MKNAIYQFLCVHINYAIGVDKINLQETKKFMTVDSTVPLRLH